MTITELEERAGSQAANLLAIIETKRRMNIALFVKRKTFTELAWIVLALANSYLRVESERDELQRRVNILGRENEMLNTANEALFRERRKLSARVEELRDIVFHREGKKAA